MEKKIKFLKKWLKLTKVPATKIFEFSSQLNVSQKLKRVYAYNYLNKVFKMPNEFFEAGTRCIFDKINTKKLDKENEYLELQRLENQFLKELNKIGGEQKTD